MNILKYGMIKQRIIKMLNSKFLKFWISYLKLINKHHSWVIKKFKHIHKGKTIFCLGAGPSLLKENLQLLNNQIVIFTNSSYKIIDQISPQKKYWIVQDKNRLKELNNVSRKIFDVSFRSMHDLEMLDIDTITREDVFIRPEFEFEFTVRRLFQRIFVPKPIESGTNFSHDLSKFISISGSTVIFSAIQLAYYMGAVRIVLLGFDMNWGNDAQSSYFDRNSARDRQFSVPSYKESVKPALVVYKRLLEEQGVELINSTICTKEDVLKKMSLTESIKL